MGKTIRLNESELINIIRKIVLDSPMISEVKKVEDFDEYSPVYTYKKIKVEPNKYNPNEIGNVFFNGEWNSKTDYLPSEEKVYITFTGPNGDFTFESNHVERATNGNPYVKRINLNYNYYDRLRPLMPVNPPQQTTSYSSSDTDKKLEIFKGYDIKRALKLTFPEYWVKETPEIKAGLRGIETIGDYLKKTKGYDGNTNYDWSIMNFFNTRAIPEKINQRWEKEYKSWKGDKVNWLVNIFKNDKEYLKELLDRQWKSIYSGFFETEPSALKKLKQMFEEDGLEVTFKSYDFGHKTDQNSGIDVEYTIKGEEPRGVQIKPLSKIQYLENGDIKVFTNSMSNDYIDKPNLDYILYDNGNTFYLFSNSDYKVVPNTNGGQVIHFKDPVRIYTEK